MVAPEQSHRKNWAGEAGKRVGEVVTRAIEIKNPLKGAAIKFAEGVAHKIEEKLRSKLDGSQQSEMLWSPSDPKVLLYLNGKSVQIETIDNTTVPADQLKRAKGYPERLKSFIERLNTELPERTQVELRVEASRFGGSSARDQVTIRAFDDQGKIVGVDKFVRKVRAEDRYSGALYLRFPLEAAAEMLLSEPKRDKMFFNYILNRAKQMAENPGVVGKFTDAARVPVRNIGLGCYIPKVNLTI